jgi:hypothetical protein
MNTSENHKENRDSRPENRHAVVLGGSLAGLLAARVLSDHFEHVTLIERDIYPETVEARRGIPQANHVHALLLRGRQVLETPALPLSNPDGLDVDELADPKFPEFTSVAGVLDAAEGKTRI